MSDKHSRNFWTAFGPGILFAGAAIGNSHLVQSTRAGAMYGLGLLAVVIFAHFIKYPAFRFGPYYAAATGRSLIEGYRKQGWPVLAIFALSEFAVDIIIIAATSLTTAAITIALFSLPIDVKLLAIAYSIGAAIILKTGGFPLLDRISKIFVVILTLATVIATALVLAKIDWNFFPISNFEMDKSLFGFTIALMGFMPAALSLSVLQSLWVIAKSQQTGILPSTKDAMLDLNIGYVASAFLAICFLLMGAGVLHSNGVEPAPSAGQFATQVLSLYSSALGNWAGVVVGLSVLLVMFTTLLTILDGMPRMLCASYIALFEQRERLETPFDNTRTYVLLMMSLIAGSAITLLFLMRSFTGFIDFVTITSFVVAPLIATLNHIAVHSDDMPATLRPSSLMRWWSRLGILFLTSMSLVFIWTRMT